MTSIRLTKLGWLALLLAIAVATIAIALVKSASYPSSTRDKGHSFTLLSVALSHYAKEMK